MDLEVMEKRAENLNRHIQEHPTDYVAVIAEMQLKSDIIDKMNRDGVNARLKEVARIRKRRKQHHEEQRQRNGNG